MAKEKTSEMTDNKERKDRFKVLRIIKNIILGTLIAFLTLVLITSFIAKVKGSSPSIFGFSLYRVSSGSMEPELQISDVILVQGCDGNDVKEEDIVTYLATSGEMKGKLITHRVIKAPYQENGEYYIITKGDANKVSDDPVKTSQIEGKMLFKIGFLKYLFDFFVTPWGLLTIIALVILAFSNEIVVFVKALFGYGYEEKQDIDEIIERYQKDNLKKQLEEQSKNDSTETGEADE